MSQSDLAEHLRFFSELGVTGISRDASWRRREELRSVQPEIGDLGSGIDEHGLGTDLDPIHADSPSPIAEPRSPVADPGAAGPERFPLTVIREDLGDCTRCKLHGLGRKQIVFGVGSPSADLMFVGEAPGADEDIQGEPFVGRAGQLLTKMIEAMGFNRSDVYIANVLKCRPPNNRNPEPDEIEQCEPFLFRQIASIQPKVIIALGAFAARTLLKTNDPISRLRGRVYDYRGAKLIPTFHPSFLLRSPGYKREAWDDLKKALALLDREPPAPASSPRPSR
jgi:uracil-DNA glycosylase family 4